MARPVRTEAAAGEKLNAALQEARGAVDAATSGLPDLNELQEQAQIVAASAESFNKKKSERSTDAPKEPWYTRLANWFRDLPSAISEAIRGAWKTISAFFSGAASSSASTSPTTTLTGDAAAATHHALPIYSSPEAESPSPASPGHPGRATDQSRGALLTQVAAHAQTLDRNAATFANSAAALAAAARAENDAPKLLQHFPRLCRFFGYNDPNDSKSLAASAASPAAGASTSADVTGAAAAASAAASRGGKKRTGRDG